MFRSENSAYLSPDDDKLLEFDLARRRPNRVTNIRRKKSAGRYAVAGIAVLSSFGILMPLRKNPSPDQSERALLPDPPFAVEPIEAAAATSMTNTAPSNDWPFPDPDDGLEALYESDAPVISDASSSPAAAPPAPQSEAPPSAPVGAPKTGPLASPATIPMSAFPTVERIWTKASGKYLLASALAYDELRGSVMLRSSDGRVLSTVAIEELCPADLEFLSQLTALADNQTAD